MTQIFRRTLIQPILLGLALSLTLSLGCAHQFFKAPAYSATGTATINRALPAKEERRDAINRAETQARDQILLQTRQLRLRDGRSIEDVAVVDPFIRAALMDAVRNAHVVDRSVSSEGRVTVTLSMDIEPLARLLQNYQPSAAGK
jgi:hypothetical protein